MRVSVGMSEDSFKDERSAFLVRLDLFLVSEKETILYRLQALLYFYFIVF